MSHAESKAKKILEEQKINKPPVPVEIIAKKIGAKLSFAPFKGEEDVSAILYRDDKTTVIGVNSAHSNTRQRFSIAHEIGHLTLHHKKKLFVDKVVRVDFRDRTSSLAIDKEEIEANAFAAELLMPHEFIRKEISRRLSRRRSSPTKDELIDALARTFKVSPQAMEYRLNNLGILITQ